ncbi:hypothetical protein E2562_030747 [Oryza meyeriana var. granulata]|uniref:Uncharacterized protein n=1 Tax=Oryza meyeriana var. granulata TaxID=110450 RepID=A0A6G1E6R4_9ORYZ|nr:hypothetical protein E2562_030747 [Oryza meyeriana var. granulata]
MELQIPACSFELGRAAARAEVGRVAAGTGQRWPAGKTGPGTRWKGWAASAAGGARLLASSWVTGTKGARLGASNQAARALGVRSRGAGLGR